MADDEDKGREQDQIAEQEQQLEELPDRSYLPELQADPELEKLEEVEKTRVEDFKQELEEFRYKPEREAAARMYHLVDDGTGLKHLVRGIPEPEPELEEFGDDVLGEEEHKALWDEFYRRERERARRYWAAIARFELPEGFTKAQLEERLPVLLAVATSEELDQVMEDYKFLLSVVSAKEED